MNVLDNHLLLFSCVAVVVCVLLAVLFRAEGMRLRAALVLCGLAAMLSLGQSVFPLWVEQMAEAALLLAVIHLVFSFGLRHLTGDRLPKILVEIFIFAGYVAVFAVTVSRLGVNLSGLLATSAVATALIGLSMQETLSNLAAGISLQLEQSISTGDWIKSSGGTGHVKYIRLRHTLIETADSDQILVPNSVLTKSEVTIISVKRRRLVPFLVGYGEAPTRIIGVVEEALRARGIAGVAGEPAPRCIIMEFQTQTMQLGVYLWLLRPGNEANEISEVMMRIYFALSRIGVKVGQSPYVIETRPPEGEANPRERNVQSGEAALTSMELFRALNADEIRTLAGRLGKLSFAPGELILRQGDLGDSLYCISQGAVRVLIGDAGHPSEEVALLSTGSFFGEMSLLTGEPRSATVLAATQVDCWCLQKPALQDIFESRPEVLQDVASVLAKRSVELADARQRLSHENTLRLQGVNQSTLLHRIQKFFGARSAA